MATVHVLWSTLAFPRLVWLSLWMPCLLLGPRPSVVVLRGLHLRCHRCPGRWERDVGSPEEEEARRSREQTEETFVRVSRAFRRQSPYSVSVGIITQGRDAVVRLEKSPKIGWMTHAKYGEKCAREGDMVCRASVEEEQEGERRCQKRKVRGEDEEESRGPSERGRQTWPVRRNFHLWPTTLPPQPLSPSPLLPPCRVMRTPRMALWEIKDASQSPGVVGTSWGLRKGKRWSFCGLRSHVFVSMHSQATLQLVHREVAWDER
jgi:hypothetical protein